jgi:homoserine acetyltransferase
LKNPLQNIILNHFKLSSRKSLDINWSYQVFGPELFSAPTILINHALTERCSLKAYHLMNHLLMTIDANQNSLNDIEADIHLISVDSDLFFPSFEIKKCFENLIKSKANTFYHEIKSVFRRFRKF